VESLGSFRARVEKTMLKLIREAHVYTRWSNPDREYEELVSRFVARALDASGSNDFLDSFVPWMAEVARLGSSK
jgi:(1->4)-alpha-D-glucan 1-alpha-D-glucosylmutase